MFLHPSLTAWLIELACRTVNQALRTSLITNSTSSGTWASASQASWWVKQWKHTFGGNDDSFVCGCLRTSSPLCRSSGWSSVWCSVVPSATAERSSKRSREEHSIDLTIIHPGTRKMTIIKKVPSCNQLTLPEFPFVRFFFFLYNILSRHIYHAVEAVWFLPPTWQSSTCIWFSFLTFGHLHQFYPTHCLSSVNVFSHSLNIDPLAVGNFSQGEHGEEK